MKELTSQQMMERCLDYHLEGFLKECSDSLLKTVDSLEQSTMDHGLSDDDINCIHDYCIGLNKFIEKIKNKK
jgi:hypothetical protein